MKDKLARLAPTVRRELADAATRRAARRAEAGLRASEARFRSFVDHAADAFFLHDDRGVILDVNEKACEQLGYAREELIGLSSEKIDPQANPEFLEKMLVRLAAGEIFTFESNHRRKDGTLFAVEVRARPFWQDGRLYAISLARDISARRQMAQLLLAREKQFRTLAENMPDVIVRYYRECRRIYVNPAYERVNGLSAEHVLGKTPTEVASAITIAGDPAGGLEKRLRAVIATGAPATVDLQWRNGEGVPVFFELRAVPELDSAGTVVSVLAIARDVTEHKRLEAARQAHVQFLEWMDRVNQTIRHAADLEQMMRETLGFVLDAFQCDRAYLMFPCDPHADSWTAPMECTRPEYPGVLKRGLTVPMDAEVAEAQRILLQADRPVKFGPDAVHPVPKPVSEQFAVRSFMATAIYPKVGRPWQFGIHQCSHARNWTTEEERLFQEIGRRLADGLSSLLAFRDLQRSQEHLSALISSVDGVVWEADATTFQFTFVSEQAVRLLGYPLRQWLEQPAFWAEHLHPDDRERAVNECLQRVRQKEDHQLEYRFLAADGRALWLRDIVTVVVKNGEVAALRGIMVDITAQKAAEQRIRKLNRTYAVLSDINQLIVRERDPNVILDGVCRIAVQTGGFQLAWIGLREAPDSRRLKLRSQFGADARMLEELQRSCATGDLCCTSIMHVLESGGYLVCSEDKHDPAAIRACRKALQKEFCAMASFALVAEGRAIGVLNLYSTDLQFFDQDELALLNEMAADISYALENCERERQRLRGEEKLRASEERFREIAETIDEVFWVSDATFDRVFYVSPAYEIIWGRACQHLLDHPHSWLEAVHPDDRENVQHAFGASVSSDYYRADYRIVRPDGQVRWISDHGIPVPNASGQIERIVGVARDVTEIRQLGEQLRQSQKLEAIGQLAGGVAHDFNNILSAILMQADLIASSGNLTGEDLQGIHEIRADTERAANLTRQLLLFSRKQMMQARDLDLNEVVTGLAKMLQRIIGEDVRLQLNLHSMPVLIYADAGMLEQVLMNLAVNARDAMPDGGRLKIETADVIVDEAGAHAHPEAMPGRYACVSVADTGCGIAAEVLPRIFEPFFTTKEPGKGTGLGLATVFGIVRQHQGWVAVESEPGHGATFNVYLPATTVVGAREKAPVAAKPRGGNENEIILVTEDEATVRRTIRMILTRHGYKVVCAATGGEAISAWKLHGNAISLLLTDLVMPGGMNGQQLAQTLRADRPDLKVVFISGYAGRVGGKEIQLQPGERFVQKTFHTNEILEFIRRPLDE